jgi:hypothetical protein
VVSTKRDRLFEVLLVLLIPFIFVYSVIFGLHLG